MAVLYGDIHWGLVLGLGERCKSVKSESRNSFRYLYDRLDRARVDRVFGTTNI